MNHLELIRQPDRYPVTPQFRTKTRPIFPFWGEKQKGKSMKYLKILGIAAVVAMALMDFVFRPIIETAQRYFASFSGAEISTTKTVDHVRPVSRTLQATLKGALFTKQLEVNNSISNRQVCLA